MMVLDNELKEPRPEDRERDFWLHVSDAGFAFRPFQVPDQKVTGAQIAELVGASPASDFVVIVQLATYELEELRPTELVDLKSASRFFVIHGDSLHRFSIDGLSMIWPRPALKGIFLKQLVGKENAEIELLLERENQPDRIIGNDEEMKLSRDGVEKFRTRPIRSTVTIIVEGTEHEWLKPRISYDEVVTLEVPNYAQHPEITYSVKYTNGPNNRPEGTLTKGDTVRVKDRMIFNVSETGQS